MGVPFRRYRAVGNTSVGADVLEFLGVSLRSPGGDRARLVSQIRAAWPDVEIWLRADGGFAREALMSWCEDNRVQYVFGLARNPRLEAMIAVELAEAKARFAATSEPARAFRLLVYATRDS
jgi:hypothetical protein